MRHITAQHRGRALWITFDRPEKLNILHPADLSELRDVIADLPPGVQAIVFTGAGQAAFSAGMNVEAFVGLAPAQAHALISDLAQVMRAVRHSPVVTVAAVNGYCLGAAFELAMACDLRVVATTASFGLPEIKVGTAMHPRPVTAAQRRLFDLWLNNPLDASVDASMTEFAQVFGSQETQEQIARHHKRITG